MEKETQGRDKGSWNRIQQGYEPGQYSLTRKAEKIYEKNIVCKIKENPKKFWMYVRRKTKYRSGIPDLEIKGATGTTAGNKQKAEGVTDVIYCDFMKVVDKVPHKRLLKKIESYGISGKTHRWIQWFLLNRYQRVRVQGSFSSWQSVLSGIPQGSVLGPLMFVIYINDLPSVVEDSDSYLFADGTTLFKGIFSGEDCAQLQLDLDRMYEWTNTSLLKFHPNKCKQMRIGTRDKPDRQYTL